MSAYVTIRHYTLRKSRDKKRTVGSSPPPYTDVVAAVVETTTTTTTLKSYRNIKNKKQNNKIKK